MKGIRLVSLAVGGPSAHDGRWVRSYSPDGYGGRGSLVTTNDPTRALSFAGIPAAMDFYRQQSATHPKRIDLQPNRPLTAYTIEILSLPEPT